MLMTTLLSMMKLVSARYQKLYLHIFTKTHFKGCLIIHTGY